mmetsp:Transcript_27439/g.54834  ORF Transcript_27439/g.54834 Transcript_27439/m.54834 type:complete len:327 (-) Transcript_27439:2762-3742(-)
MRQFSARIWYCWTDVTRVHLPCLIMSTQDLMEGIFEVKGAATDASPIFTVGKPSSSSMSSNCAAILAAELATPAFLRISAFFLLTSLISSDIISFMAFHWALQVDSPCASSSATLAIIFFCFSAASSCLDFLAMAAFSLLRSAAFFLSCFTTAVWIAVLRYSCTSSDLSVIANLSGSVPISLILALISLTGRALILSSSCCEIMAVGLSPVTAFLAPSSPLSTLRSPNPLNRATPTSACLRAPTSLAPSPHMRQRWPTPCKFSMTVSLASGLILAKILKYQRTSLVFESYSYAFSSTLPVTQSSLPALARLGTLEASNSTTLSSFS